MLLKTYKDRVQKKICREFLFSLFDVQELIALAGPDINETIEWYSKKGFKKIHIYENDKKTMLNQIKKYNLNYSITHTFGDILNVDANRKNTLLDLDFTKSIITMGEYVKKYKKDKFIMTFALRPISYVDTLKKFFNIREEKIISVKEYSDPVTFGKIISNRGTYVTLKYKDKKCINMMCIAKIK
jgi:hypothetical protein